MLVSMNISGRRYLYNATEEIKEGRRMKTLKTRAGYRSQRGGTKVSSEKDYSIGQAQREEIKKYGQRRKEIE